MTVNPLVTNNNQPLLSGTVSSLLSSVGIAQVQVLVGSQTLTATVTGNVWNVVPAVLPDGTYNVEAIATDAAGNTTIDNALNSLIVDTVAPVANVTPLTTNHAKPTLSGTVNPLPAGVGIASLSVVVDGQTVAATVSGSSWTASLTSALADGTYDVQTTVKDVAGNSSTSTAGGALVIDTVAPQVGMTPWVTNSSRPLFGGTMSDAAPSSGIASVTVVVGGQTLTATLASSTWRVTVPQALADGTYNVQLTAVDNAGNSTTTTVVGGLIIDTVKPVVTVKPLVTNNNKPTLSGTVSDAAPSSGIASVSLLVNGQTFSATVTGNTWTAAVPAALPDGAYDVQVTAADRAGNSATDLAAHDLTVDTVAPVVTVSTLITNENAPTLSGRIANIAPSSGIASVTVLVVGQTIPATVTGTTWTATVPVALADGSYTVAATAADNAGNVTTATVLNALVVDTVPPVVTVAKLVTNDNTPTLSGTVSDPRPAAGWPRSPCSSAGRRSPRRSSALLGARRSPWPWPMASTTYRLRPPTRPGTAPASPRPAASSSIPCPRSSPSIRWSPTATRPP